MRPVKAILGMVGFGALMATQASAATVTVHIYDFEFSTNTIGQPIVDPTINLGDTVHWVWDAVQFPHSTHSVSGITESWDSGMFATPGHTFDHTFTHTGTFWYFCDAHGFDNGNGTAGGMSGFITVVPEPVSCISMLLGVGALAARRRRKAA
jgi:plastocyanin